MDWDSYIQNLYTYMWYVFIMVCMYVCVYVNWLIQIKDTKYKNSSKWKQKGIAETDTEYSNNFVYATIFAFFFLLSNEG